MEDNKNSSFFLKLNLTEEEELLYNILRKNNWLLEQEKVPLYWVKEKLDKTL